MSDVKNAFDLSYLNQVFQGNKSLVTEIVELFLKQVPEYVEAMERHLDDGSFDKIHPLAHKSKSSASMLGLRDLECRLIEIETFSKTGTNDLLHDRMKELRERLNVCVQQLQLHLTEQL